MKNFLYSIAIAKRGKGHSTIPPEKCVQTSYTTQFLASNKSHSKTPHLFMEEIKLVTNMIMPCSLTTSN